MILVHSPQFHGDIVIKENLGKGTKPGDKMTADEDGDSELMELSTTPKAPQAMVKQPVTKKAQRGVPKAAEVVVLDMPRTVPCNQCTMGSRDCLPPMKAANYWKPVWHASDRRSPVRQLGKAEGRGHL